MAENWDKNSETEEENAERLRIVRATQIFGDTPTDPTIGDTVVPTHDEEGGNVNVAAADADDSDESDDVSDGEAKRQAETPQFDAAAEAKEEEDSKDDEDSKSKSTTSKSSTTRKKS